MMMLDHDDRIIVGSMGLAIVLGLALPHFTSCRLPLGSTGPGQCHVTCWSGNAVTLDPDYPVRDGIHCRCENGSCLGRVSGNCTVEFRRDGSVER